MTLWIIIECDSFSLLCSRSTAVHHWDLKRLPQLSFHILPAVVICAQTPTTYSVITLLWRPSFLFKCHFKCLKCSLLLWSWLVNLWSRCASIKTNMARCSFYSIFQLILLNTCVILSYTLVIRFFNVH